MSRQSTEWDWHITELWLQTNWWTSDTWHGLHTAITSHTSTSCDQ